MATQEPSEITIEHLESVIRERVKAEHLEIEDIGCGCGKCGQMVRVFVVSPLFEGKMLIERQRMVNEALKEELKRMHAVQYKKTLTPAQYQKYLAEQAATATTAATATPAAATAQQ